MTDIKIIMNKIIGNFFLYDIDYIKRDEQGKLLRWKTKEEIKQEIKNKYYDTFSRYKKN